jgi:hypothetical protein
MKVGVNSLIRKKMVNDHEKVKDWCSQLWYFDNDCLPFFISSIFLAAHLSIQITFFGNSLTLCKLPTIHIKYA